MPSPRSWLIIGLVVAIGAWFASHATLSVQWSTQSESVVTDPVNNKQLRTNFTTPASKIAKELYTEGEDEVEELLMGILALEKLHSVESRSYGAQYGWRSERFINACRQLTDMQVEEHYPELKPRIAKLRTALEKFASAVPDAAMTHHVTASAYARETNMKMMEFERMIRIEAVGGDGVRADFERKVNSSPGSPPIQIDVIRICILQSTPAESPILAPNEVEQARQALIDTLPAIQEALREWPPDFSQKVESYINEWVKEWMGK
jgi:hypothetical protein